MVFIERGETHTVTDLFEAPTLLTVFSLAAFYPVAHSSSTEADLLIGLCSFPVVKVKVLFLFHEGED